MEEIDAIESDAKQNILDVIGPWSEIKLEILKKYSSAYSTILAKQAEKGQPLKFYYIDAFAGAGVHRTKENDELVPGSPTNALLIKPGFSGYCFIDMDHEKVERLEKLAAGRKDVKVISGNCNTILLERVLPKITYEKRMRGLCLLDPYGLQLSWEVMELAGKMRTLEFFLNFPIMDMNRNVLWRDPKEVTETQKHRLDYFWGDRSWEEVAWETESDLFGDPTKTTNDHIVKAFQKRLKTVAGLNMFRIHCLCETKTTLSYITYFSLRIIKLATKLPVIFSKNIKNSRAGSGHNLLY